MDDLAILAENLTILQSHTNIFSSFLNLNSIKCNEEKTKLITTLKNNHPKRQIPLLVNQTNIYPERRNIAFKYLGIYISGQSPELATSKNVFPKLSELISTIALQKTWNAYITKQVIEWIVLPTLAYANHSTHFLPSSLKKLQTKINNL